MNDDNPVWPPIETPEKLLREIGPVGTPAPDRTAELAAALARVTADRDRWYARCGKVFDLLEKRIEQEFWFRDLLAEAMQAGLEECERLRAKLAIETAVSFQVARDCDSAVAELSTLRTRSDETLRRVRVALGSLGVADCDDPIDALEALAADVSRRNREAAEEHNAAVRGAHADGRAEGLEKALAVLDTLGVGQDVLRRVESEVSRG